MQPQIAPFVMVIFGATGDLTARKLIPALYNLLEDGVLPEKFIIVGFARRSFTHEAFRTLMKEAIVKHSRKKSLSDKTWKTFSENLFYQQGMFEDDAPYDTVVKLLSDFDKKIGACITRFFYLATPPINYSTILQKLATTKLAEGCGQGSSKWTRVLIEKPFGKDLETARTLEEQLAHTFEERQIYRIDHYLAKEAVQNILAFRFANGIFEHLWNREHIDHIQITLAESNGVEKRGAFYEGVGALRDIAQNHLMAMLAYIAMEPPRNMSVEAVRGERVKVLDSIARMDFPDAGKSIVRGQYGKEKSNSKDPASPAGGQISKIMRGYREEENVDPNSCTETFVAFKLFIDNPRWQGVPFYVRTGKRMPVSDSRISIQFKKPTNNLFSINHESKVMNQESIHMHDNVLTFRIQPKEGISLQILAKEPGFGYKLHNVKMDFSYRSSFKKDISDSYERLLIDSMMGDQTLFATGSGFHATWKLMTDIMKIWDPVTPAFPNYEAGTWGPKEADELMERDGRHWLLH
jgi:glucose-6-phosphate 1-dehydrogenase